MGDFSGDNMMLAGGRAAPDMANCERPEQGADWHARWLAMQSAYAEYRRSSDALEAAREEDNNLVDTDLLRLTVLERQQRVAFERYMDARIAFLESQFDEFNRPAGDPGDTPTDADGRPVDSRPRSWPGVSRVRAVLEVLAVLLLCTTAFSLMREQTRIRRLEGERDVMRSAILQATQQLQTFRQKLDADPRQLKPSLLVEPVPTTAAMKPVSPHRREVGKAVGEAKATNRRPPTSAGNANRSAVAERSGRVSRGRSLASFSLSPSRKFKRVGPVSILLESVDAQRATATLSVLAEVSRVEVFRVRLSQPVWIKTRDPNRLLGLIADRISGTRLIGRLVEASTGKPDLKATQFHPNTEAPQEPSR